MKPRYILAVIIITVFLLFAAGSFLSEQCITISEDKACWKTTTVLINSTLCPNVTQPCLAKPEMQQYNAIADLLLTACDKAKSEAYSNTERTARIEEVVNLFMGLQITAQQLCEQPGMVLTKRMYE
jgi:hypothetical protein